MRDYPKIENYPVLTAYCYACKAWEADRRRRDNRSILILNAIAMAWALATLACVGGI